tara:strand:- start:429 stop:1127 length:699 start_codon:yes stop_codon:yes gene_type:complete
MNAFDEAWALLKGVTQFDYDVETSRSRDKRFPELRSFEDGKVKPMGLPRARAITLYRHNVFEPVPGLPGFVFYDDPLEGIRGKLITEAEAEEIWPSHIDKKVNMAMTTGVFGLPYELESAAWDNKDEHLYEDDTARRFGEKVAPVIAHEVAHALDSDLVQGGFAQREMPAHVLEGATEMAMRGRDSSGGISEVLPYANERLNARLYELRRGGASVPSNPDYEYDITDDTIVS